MSLVNVYNEWDPLEEVIIGTVTGARVPVPDRGLFALEYPEYGTVDKIPSGPYARHIVEETEHELSMLCEELTKLGVKVRRPEARDHAAKLATPDWRTDGFYDYCPRDVFLAVGGTVIETPMVLRSRFLEPFAYKNMLLEFFESGARWVSDRFATSADDRSPVVPSAASSSSSPEVRPNSIACARKKWRTGCSTSTRRGSKSFICDISLSGASRFRKHGMPTWHAAMPGRRDAEYD